jgi:hypothetical protein
MNRTCYFWLAGSKHLPVLKDTAKWVCWLLLCWLVERERGKGGEKSIHPSTAAWGLLNYYSLCCLVESEREEKERRKVALSERENKSFWDSWSIPLASWKTQFRSLWSVSVRCLLSKWVAEYSFRSSILLRAHLFHPCMRVSRWGVGPEC